MATTGEKRARSPSILELGPRKTPRASDPYVHYGRHIGRAIHGFLNMQKLLKKGIEWMNRLGEGVLPSSFPESEQRDYSVFQELMNHIPNFGDTLVEASADEVVRIAEQLQKGINGARSDDAKGLKSAILRWIKPPGGMLIPELSEHDKSGRGFNHNATGALLCPAGWDWSDESIKNKLRAHQVLANGAKWPILLYENGTYDKENPWAGLFRNTLLVKTAKRIFTSPSSVEMEIKATRSGNAGIHGMTSMTRSALAYVCTQTRFALSSAQLFNRSDLVTDSERFYNGLRNFLTDPDEQDQVEPLLEWWNQQLFPQHQLHDDTDSDEDLAQNALRRFRALRAIQSRSSNAH